MIEAFELFRKNYPGTKRGYETELKVFQKHKDWRKCVDLLLPALQNELEWREACAAAGIWVPPWKIMQTWLNQRCWEQELPVVPKKLAQTPQPLVTAHIIAKNIKEKEDKNVVSEEEKERIFQEGLRWEYEHWKNTGEIRDYGNAYSLKLLNRKVITCSPEKWLNVKKQAEEILKVEYATLKTTATLKGRMSEARKFDEEMSNLTETEVKAKGLRLLLIEYFNTL